MFTAWQIISTALSLLQSLRREQSGSTAIEYALLVSGVGTTGGILAALGVDVTALLQSVDFSLCDKLVLRSVCM